MRTRSVALSVLRISRTRISESPFSAVCRRIGAGGEVTKTYTHRHTHINVHHGALEANAFAFAQRTHTKTQAIHKRVQFTCIAADDLVLAAVSATSCRSIASQCRCVCVCVYILSSGACAVFLRACECLSVFASCVSRRRMKRRGTI